MNRSVWISLSLFGIFALALLALPACDSTDHPVAPGQEARSAPSAPCSGVFGNNTVGTAFTGVTDLFFYPVVSAAVSTLTQISVYTSSTSAVTYEAGVYSNNGTQPWNLLAETGPQTVSAPATLWNTATLDHAIALSAGVTYWLAYEATPANSARDNSAVIAYCYQPQGAFGTLAPSFTGTVSSGFIFSVYGITCP